jgi:2-dehydro-3-deoxygalactonokinase
MSDRFIAGDWGSSRLRLYLCEGGEVLDRLAGPGAIGPGAPHEAVLKTLIEPWLVAHGATPILLSGMIGSRNGWVEAPYAPCPAGTADLRARLVRFEAFGRPVAIVPGVAGENPTGAPEVMRGEETQIIGALALSPDLAEGSRLLALPGTHTKWVMLEDGRITGFQTALTGELFAVLRDHSSLAKVSGGEGEGEEGFAEGLARQDAAASPGLLHQLFEVRSRQLIDGWSASRALNFLSGLLIGADVASAALPFPNRIDGVVLVGDPLLNARYEQALARRGLRSRSLDGEACALAGLRAIIQTQGAEPHVAR